MIYGICSFWVGRRAVLLKKWASQPITELASFCRSVERLRGEPRGVPRQLGQFGGGGLFLVVVCEVEAEERLPDGVRLRGVEAEHHVFGGALPRRHPRQLRPLLHRHLQRPRQHRLERQLHVAAHAQGHQSEVRGFFVILTTREMFRDQKGFLFFLRTEERGVE